MANLFITLKKYKNFLPQNFHHLSLSPDNEYVACGVLDTTIPLSDENQDRDPVAENATVPISCSFRFCHMTSQLCIEEFVVEHCVSYDWIYCTHPIDRESRTCCFVFVNRESQVGCVWLPQNPLSQKLQVIQLEAQIQGSSGILFMTEGKETCEESIVVSYINNVLLAKLHNIWNPNWDIIEDVGVCNFNLLILKSRCRICSVFDFKQFGKGGNTMLSLTTVFGIEDGAPKRPDAFQKNVAEKEHDVMYPSRFLHCVAEWVFLEHQGSIFIWKYSGELQGVVKGIPWQRRISKVPGAPRNSVDESNSSTIVAMRVAQNLQSLLLYTSDGCAWLIDLDSAIRASEDAIPNYKYFQKTIQTLTKTDGSKTKLESLSAQNITALPTEPTALTSKAWDYNNVVAIMKGNGPECAQAVQQHPSGSTESEIHWFEEPSYSKSENSSRDLEFRECIRSTDSFNASVLTSGFAISPTAEGAKVKVGVSSAGSLDAMLESNNSEESERTRMWGLGKIWASSVKIDDDINTTLESRADLPQRQMCLTECFLSPISLMVFVSMFCVSDPAKKCMALLVYPISTLSSGLNTGLSGTVKLEPPMWYRFPDEAPRWSAFPVMAQDRSLLFLSSSQQCSAFIPSVGKNELLHNLIMYEKGTLADVLCGLNGWDQRALRIHALQLGLGHQQPSVVRQALFSLDPDQQMMATKMLLQYITRNDVNNMEFLDNLLRCSIQFVNNIVLKVSSDIEESKISLSQFEIIECASQPECPPPPPPLPLAFGRHSRVSSSMSLVAPPLPVPVEEADMLDSANVKTPDRSENASENDITAKLMYFTSVLETLRYARASILSNRRNAYRGRARTKSKSKQLGPSRLSNVSSTLPSSFLSTSADALDWSSAHYSEMDILIDAICQGKIARYISFINARRRPQENPIRYKDVIALAPRFIYHLLQRANYGDILKMSSALNISCVSHLEKIAFCTHNRSLRWQIIGFLQQRLQIEFGSERKEAITLCRTMEQLYPESKYHATYDQMISQSKASAQLSSPHLAQYKSSSDVLPLVITGEVRDITTLCQKVLGFKYTSSGDSNGVLINLDHPTKQDHTPTKKASSSVGAGTIVNSKSRWILDSNTHTPSRGSENTAIGQSEIPSLESYKINTLDGVLEVTEESSSISVTKEHSSSNKHKMGYMALNLNFLQHLDVLTVERIFLEAEYQIPIRSQVAQIQYYAAHNDWLKVMTWLKHSTLGYCEVDSYGNMTAEIQKDLGNLLDAFRNSARICAPFIKHIFMNELARRGIFPHHLVPDSNEADGVVMNKGEHFECIQRQLANLGLLFLSADSVHLLPHDLSSHSEHRVLGLSQVIPHGTLSRFHSYFCKFCVDAVLPNVMQAYLEHYKVGYSIEQAQTLAVDLSKPWLALLLKMLAREDRFGTAMANANLCLHRSFSSIVPSIQENSALLEAMMLSNRPLMVIGTLSCEHAGILEYVMSFPNSSELLQLFQEVVSGFPPLEAALFFPIISDEEFSFEPIIDHGCKIIEKWLSEPLAKISHTHRDNEIERCVRFNDPELLDAATKVNMTLREHLLHGDIVTAYQAVKEQNLMPDHVEETCYLVCSQRLDDNGIASACISLMDIMKLNTQMLRADLAAIKLLRSSMSHLSLVDVRLDSALQKEVAEILNDRVLKDPLAENLFVSYSSFCIAHNLPRDYTHLKTLARNGLYVELFYVAQINVVPPENVYDILEECFPPSALKTHLMLVARSLLPNCRSKPATLFQANVMDGDSAKKLDMPNLFFEILQAENSIGAALIQAALKYEAPFLAILASCYNVPIDRCFWAYLITSAKSVAGSDLGKSSINPETELSDYGKPLSETELQMLSDIICLRIFDSALLMIRAFSLFAKNHPLLSAIEYCRIRINSLSDLRAARLWNEFVGGVQETPAKEEVIKDRALIGGIFWTLNVMKRLFNILIEKSKTCDTIKLLSPLESKSAITDTSWTSELNIIFNTAKILQKSNVRLHPSLSPLELIDQLVKMNKFDPAREIAVLNRLQEQRDVITIQQANLLVGNISNDISGRERERPIQLFDKVSALFEKQKVNPVAAVSYFLKQAAEPGGRVDERVALLKLALPFLQQQLQNTPTAELEKEIAELKITIKVLESVSKEHPEYGSELSSISISSLANSGMLQAAVTPLLDKGDVETAEEIFELMHIPVSSETLLVKVAKSFAHDVNAIRELEQRGVLPAESLADLSGTQLMEKLCDLCVGGGQAFTQELLFQCRLCDSLGIQLAELPQKDQSVVFRLLLCNLEKKENLDLARLYRSKHLQNHRTDDIASIMAEVYTDYLIPIVNRWSSSQFRGFALLCEDPRKLANRLLEIFHKRGNSLPIPAQAEILVQCHNCYVLGVSSEGADLVLDLVQKRIDRYVAAGEYGSLARILLGIQRYTEMKAIIDALITSNTFELLLRKDPRMDEMERLDLRRALSYHLKEYYPTRQKLFHMFYLSFQMFREMGDLFYTAANESILKITQPNYPPQKFKVDLGPILQLLVDAASYYQKDRCYDHSCNSLMLASLVALQSESTVRVLNLTQAEARKVVTMHRVFEEARKIARAYNLDRRSEWHRVLYYQAVEIRNDMYIEDYLRAMPTKPSLWLEITNKFKQDPKRKEREDNFKHFLEYLDDKFLLYHIATYFNFADIARPLATSLPQGLYKRWIRQNKDSLLL